MCNLLCMEAHFHHIWQNYYHLPKHDLAYEVIIITNIYEILSRAYEITGQTDGMESQNYEIIWHNTNAIFMPQSKAFT